MLCSEKHNKQLSRNNTNYLKQFIVHSYAQEINKILHIDFKEELF